jgi:hypothetical protein
MKTYKKYGRDLKQYNYYFFDIINFKEFYEPNETILYGLHKNNRETNKF